jgi:hypothetical protein
MRRLLQNDNVGTPKTPHRVTIVRAILGIASPAS